MQPEDTKELLRLLGEINKNLAKIAKGMPVQSYEVPEVVLWSDSSQPSS